MARPRVRPRLTANRSTSATTSSGACADVCATVTTDAAALGRGQPRLVAARHDLGARRAGRGPRLRRSARPADADEVAAVLRSRGRRRPFRSPRPAGAAACAARSVPCTAASSSTSLALSGIVDVDDTSLVLDVRAGTFGDTARGRAARAPYGLTLGHWPQSIDLSTVGGWLACRGAGQFSTRYGKIEDMVVGLDVVLADGRRSTRAARRARPPGPISTRSSSAPRARSAIITGARLAHPPGARHEASSAWAFATFVDGLDAAATSSARGATPAVLRLYDATEADRSYKTGPAHPRARPTRAIP